MHTQRYFITILVLLLTGLIAAQTSGDAVMQIASPTPAGATAIPHPNAIGPTNFPSNVNPLTGLVVSNPLVLERRPLAIKVSNAPDTVRPQAGLAQADLVFEHYVEGSLTRFTAIFYTNTPAYVGSVRSARLIDLEIPSMYDSLFAYSGASGPIQLRITEGIFADRAFVNSGQPLFYRDENIEIPHNLFAVPAEIWTRATAHGVNKRPILEGMAFVQALPPASVSAARQIAIDYGPEEEQWVYDEATGLYKRSVDGEVHTDALDNRQLTAANVIVIWAHHQPDITIVENEWQGQQTFSIEVQIWTLGPAILFRDGRRYDGFWHRWAEDDMLTFWRDDTMQERLYLKPGNTWFQVVPLDFTELTVNS